jgi:hypothetical protein
LPNGAGGTLPNGAGGTLPNGAGGTLPNGKESLRNPSVELANR